MDEQKKEELVTDSTLEETSETPIIKVEEPVTNPPIKVDPDEESFEEVKKKLMDLLFEFYQSLSELHNDSTDLSKQEDYLLKIKAIKDKYSENKEVQSIINDTLTKINSKLEELSKNKAIGKIAEKLRVLILDSLKADISFEFNLDDIDVKGILELYRTLDEFIERGDLKEITAARGRLIKKLKKEDPKIDEVYKKIGPFIEIKNELDGDTPSLESIKSILEREDNKYLLFYFKEYLDDLEVFKNKFEEIFNRNEIQQVIFLEEALMTQLERQKSLLEERYQTEFLDRKGNLPSIITVLPGAVKLSIQKLALTISELKEAKTNRRKMRLINDAWKDGVVAAATPVVYFGKFLASNWYTIYMIYKAYGSAKKAEEERKAAEEKAKAEQEAKEKAEAEAKAKAEQEAKEKAKAEAKAKAEQEAKEKAEAEAKAKAEQEAREKAEAEAKAKAEQEAREKAEAEAKAKAEQEAREKAEAEAKAKAEQEAREKAEAEAKAKAEQEAREKAEAEAKAKAEQEAREKAAAEAKAKAEQEAREQAAAEAKAKAEQEAREKAEAEAKAKAEQESPAEQPALNPEPSPNVEVEPDPYENYRGSTLNTLIYNPSYGGNIAEQLENGIVDGDSLVYVTYQPAGTPFWMFWKVEKAQLPLRAVQAIWNWSPEINFDDYQVGKGRIR